MRGLVVVCLLGCAAGAHADPSVDRAAPAAEGGRRWGLFAGGLSLFAIGYGADAGLTYGVHHESPTTSLIPLVGPLLQIGSSFTIVSAPRAAGSTQANAGEQAAANTINHTLQPVMTAALVIDCAVQLTGLIMAITGMSTHHHGSRAGRPSFAASGMLLQF